MGEIDISNMTVGEVRTLPEAVEELGVTKGRVSQFIKRGVLDYGKRGNTMLIPESEIQRRIKENPGPGNPNFGPGYSGRMKEHRRK